MEILLGLQPFHAMKEQDRDRQRDREKQTNQRTQPIIEMRGRI